MQFKAIIVLASVATVLAAPAPISSGTVVDVYGAAPVEAAQLDARQTAKEEITAAITEAVKDAVTALAVKGAKMGAQFVKDLKNWTNAREEFTKTTVKGMWEAQTDKKAFPAAVCYNMGYKADGAAGKVKVDLKSGLLHTDYDCFYMPGNSVFKGEGDGGFINLAIQSDNNRCTFDSKAKTLTCK
ncbi:hypothetical protein PpBr36_04031 [Pyricularia pennisetigena]|uniref:hypothetical protein n=1 Tax=Pyricularia pennisetigena TaxID=1578925 RepID=UPI00115224BB|nr:hypothetical protein PpBr36_04031 [Pyricularia pennisetigena]TLS26660.1 hypothetical protein PpBr36_04031 [Pyricularia pennisetigena]